MKVVDSCMKKLKALLLILTIFSSSAWSAPKCDPAMLKILNEQYAATLFCAALKENFASCIATIQMGGLAAIFKGAWVGPHTGAEVVDYTKVSKHLSKEAQVLIEQIKAGGQANQLSSVPKLIGELQKHPRLYVDEIKTLRAALKSNIIKIGTLTLGLLSLVGTYAYEMYATPPEDCEKLKFSTVAEGDRQWVIWGGLTCNIHVNPKLFSMPLEQQAAVLERSPGLCEAVVNYRNDFEKKANAAPAKLNADQFIQTVR